MAKSGSGIFIAADTLTPQLLALSPAIRAAVSTIMEFYADKATAYARTNASWTDRTGNARQGLNAQAFTGGDEYAIIIYHQVPYGIWLEVRWDGRYAIIIPTVNAIGPQVMVSIREALRRLT